jgi:hypothetical protein
VACGGDKFWSERVVVGRKKKNAFLLSDHLRERMVEREKQCE